MWYKVFVIQSFSATRRFVALLCNAMLCYVMLCYFILCYVMLCYVMLQGDFFHWDPPKNHKYGKKLKYPNWDPPKSSKYGKPWQSVALWKLLVLYFNFFPHLENSGGSQFILRNFRGVPVRMFDVFYLPKKNCDF